MLSLQLSHQWFSLCGLTLPPPNGHNNTVFAMHLCWFKEIKHILVSIYEATKRNMLFEYDLPCDFFQLNTSMIFLFSALHPTSFKEQALSYS